MVEHVFAPFLKAVQDRFRVGLRCEGMAGAEQLAAQVLVVINFPVKRDDESAVLVLDRLVARRGNIDDRKAAETHRDAVAEIFAVRIRAAVRDDVGHVLNDGLAVV